MYIYIILVCFFKIYHTLKKDTELIDEITIGSQKLCNRR